MTRIGLLLCFLALPLSAATFTVTSPHDSGRGTLREAILDANALGAGPHTIAFDIASAGRLYTITPLTPLPVLTAAQTLLDATTQSGYTGAPIVEISGRSAGAGAHGLSIDGAMSRVRGFVINGFDSGAGVSVTAPGVDVMNNYLGLDVDGATVIPNLHGVSCTDGCSAIEIGSPSGNDRNVISGNLGAGIVIVSAGTGNSIRANYIGTDATGTFARGNFTGIEWIESKGRIGDLDRAGGNVISGNSAHGVVLTGENSGTSLLSNSIGTGADWRIPLGNGREGVSIDSSGNSVTENYIAYNRGHGVMVVGAGHERNLIRRNNILSNGLRGIALGSQGETVPNDFRDGDAGYANNLQNHPVLTSSVWDAGTLTVTGSLHSTPGTLFMIDFYSSPDCDPSGFGEGRTWHPAIDVTTDATGNGEIHAVFSHPGMGFITATASAIVPNRTVGETSELSQCRVVTNALASTVQISAATANVIEGDGFATVTVTRSGSTAGPATVEVVTRDGTASSPGDYLPPATSRLVWDNGDGAAKTVTIPIVADDMDELPEELTVELRNPTGVTLGATSSATITIQDVARAMPADLSIQIATSASITAQGEEIAYTISATNHGPNAATGVTVTNVLPPQLLFHDMSVPAGWSCTTPAVGTNGTITCTRAVWANGASARFLLGTRVAFDAAGSIVNTVTVSHSGADPNPGNSTASSSATLVYVTSADLSITKTTDRVRAAAGSAFTYTITVTNSGPDRALAVSMTDVLPPQLRFVSQVVTTTTGAEFFCTTPEVSTNGTITCSASRMAPGARATLTLHVAVAPDAVSGTVTNTASVTSPTADRDHADRSATASGVALAPGARLSIHKHTTTTSARPDSIVGYTISIRNSGPNAATNVVVTDVLPADLLFDSIGPLAGFTCTTPAVGTTGTVTCTAATFPASREAAFTLRVRVAPDARPGVVTNTATVTSSTLDPDGGHPTATAEPVTIGTPAGVERRLDPGTAAARRSQTSPQVATTRQNALAVWWEGYASFPEPDGTTAIRGALFRPDAEGETLIDFATGRRDAEVEYPAVAAADDRYLVVWREWRSPNGRVMARRIRVDGSFIDAEPLVLETGRRVCCNAEVDPRPAAASNGRDFYVTWVSDDARVMGISVPAEGPVAGQPSILSLAPDLRARGYYDLEVIWTSAMYVVVWLNRIESSVPQTHVLRYARVTSGGVLLDTRSSNSIYGRFRSMGATPYTDGVLIMVDYEEEPLIVGYRRRCVGALLLTATGEAGDVRSLHCVDEPGLPGRLRAKLLPWSRGFLLVEPGRSYTPPAGDRPIRTSTADHTLTRLSDPTPLGVVAREVAVANWGGAALLVYTRTDGDDAATGVPRVFTLLLPGYGRARAVRR